ncbi:MAG: IS21 family transposase, partial [Sulfitobacter sp.]|nr:IS21 family transposase [Sulfitobacter sp.]
FTEQVVPVTTSSTIEVKRVLYTVPSRLIGERLRLHIFDERIEGYIGSVRALTLPRVYAVSHERRARCIDYRHVIASLARKPQAFRYSQLRDELLPNATYRQIWTRIDARMEPRAACKYIVGILALAARADCERALGAYLLQRIGADRIPTVHELEQRFDPQAGEAGSQALGASQSLQHPLALYDTLLPSRRMEVH